MHQVHKEYDEKSRLKTSRVTNKSSSKTLKINIDLKNMIITI